MEQLQASQQGSGESLAQLRSRVEQLMETEPNAAVSLICATITRVEREHGINSVELAWWVGSLATPMIAFMDRFAEAATLLDFAQPILELRLGPFAPEVAEIHVARAWIAQREGKVAQSTAAWKRVVRIREREPGPRRIELQKALVGLAQCQSMQRNFAAARSSLTRAQLILAENGESVSEAAAAIENTHINIAWREENYAAVREHAQAQISIEEQMASPVAQRVPAYMWLGQSMERLNEFEGAEAALRKALEIAQSSQGAPLQRHRLAALTQLAGLLVTRGKPAEARDLAQRAVELGEQTRGAAAPILVRPLQYLGEAQQALGELPAAIRSHQRAAAIIQADRAELERPWIVAHYRALARLQLQLGERQLAQESLAQALQTAAEDPTLAVERAATLLALGISGDARGPRADFAQALDLLRSRLPDSHPAILRVLTAACALEARTDAVHAPSCEAIDQRLANAGEIDPFLSHDAFAARGVLSAKRGDLQGAYDYAIRALAAAATLGTPDPLWRAQFSLAKVLQDRGDLALAVFFGKQSIAQIELLRSRLALSDRRLDQGFIQDKADVYRLVADWLMQAGRMDEGLEVLRLLKAQELFDFVLRDARLNLTQEAVEFTPAEAAMMRRYLELLHADVVDGAEIDRLGRLQEAGRISAAEQRRLAQLLSGQREAQARRAGMVARFLDNETHQPPAPHGLRRNIQVQSLAESLASRGPGVALAVFLLTDSRLRILIGTRLGQVEHDIPVDARELRRTIGVFLDAISRKEPIDAQSRRLFALLAQPLHEQAVRAGATRLVLWLDDALRYVPFAALRNEQGYLVDRYSIETYVPVDVHGIGPAPETPPDHANLQVRGLGLTRPVAGFAALPAMADELCDVVHGPIEGLSVRGRSCPRTTFGGGALEGQGFADASFTAAQLRALLPAREQFSVLHVGSHFSLRPGNARRSFLLLGDGEQLTLDAIAELDFSGLQLVTLSACQSGLGGTVTDDGRGDRGHERDSAASRRAACHRQPVASR